jgi:hypothetical protein
MSARGPYAGVRSSHARDDRVRMSCTSTFGNVALGIGRGATASATGGLFGTAFAVGANTSATALGTNNHALAIGNAASAILVGNNDKVGVNPGNNNTAIAVGNNSNAIAGSRPQPTPATTTERMSSAPTAAPPPAPATATTSRSSATGKLTTSHNGPTDPTRLSGG